uniref:Uncharacterized protein n=1 Tax=Podarcis muralis TaxID=64176 RepID=A0A670IA39_PODMU
MFKSALTRWWDMQKIYHTQVHQELWVGALLTSFVFYKISYGDLSPGHCIGLQP